MNLDISQHKAFRPTGGGRLGEKQAPCPSRLQQGVVGRYWTAWSFSAYIAFCRSEIQSPDPSMGAPQKPQQPFTRLRRFI